MRYYLIGVVFCIMVLVLSVYYAYIYYKYTYKSVEKKLRITAIHTFKMKSTTMYFIIGEMEDMPGIEMRSLEAYSERKLKYSEGDIVTVRYISGQEFMIDPAAFLKNMGGLMIFFVLTILILLFYKK